MKKYPVLIMFSMVLCYAGIIFAQSFIFLRNKTYTVTYGVDYHCPMQVEWTVYRAWLDGGVGRSRTTFETDTRLPPPSARHADYSRSGYDRGHMIPSEDRQLDREQNRSTFLMSNVAPQTPSLNRGPWLQTEIRCRQLALVYDSVRVSAEALFLDSVPRFIDGTKIRIPSHFRKVARVAATDSVLYIWTFSNK